MSISDSKQARMRALTGPDGVIAALAMDQRGSLRQMMGAGVTDEQVVEFKRVVIAALSKHSSAVLLDPEYGWDAAAGRAPGCGLLMAYESDGYNNPRPHRMLALLAHQSVRRLAEAGVDGIKILLSYTPFDTVDSNDEKKAMVERIGHECEAAGLPFFLEPVGYDPGGSDGKSVEFARLRPEIVIRSMEEFSKDIYKVDVLKVEFPVNIAFVEGCAAYRGAKAQTRDEALDLFRRADAASRRPYIYLSAGARNEDFIESLRLAAEAGARYSGVLCGRANWQDGVPIYMKQGRAALEAWLEGEGARNVRAVNDCLSAAVGWDRR